MGNVDPESLRGNQCCSNIVYLVGNVDSESLRDNQCCNNIVCLVGNVDPEICWLLYNNINIVYLWELWTESHYVYLMLYQLCLPDG